MKHITAALLIGLFALTICPTVSAGQKHSYEVRIDLAQRYATGGIGSARNSTDSNQLMYCRVVAQDIAPQIFVACGAVDAAGKSVYCQTTQAHFADAVQAINSDSEVYFTWKPVSGSQNQCTYININNGSLLESKKP